MASLKVTIRRLIARAINARAINDLDLLRVIIGLRLLLWDFLEHLLFCRLRRRP